MAFRQEQFDTGIAATALGALVLFALLVAGVLVLGRLSGNVLFGTSIEAGAPFDVLAISPTETEPISTDAPPLAEPLPPPAPVAPAAQAPAPAAPAPPPAPAVEPAAPAEPAGDDPGPVRSPLPEVPTLGETLDDPVGSVVRVTTSIVEPAGSTVEDLLDVPLDLLFGHERKSQPTENYAAR